MGDDGDDKFIEEQFILRVPAEQAQAIRERIRTDNFAGFELELPGVLQQLILRVIPNIFIEW